MRSSLPVMAVLGMLALVAAVRADTGMLLNFEKIPEQYQAFVPEEVKKVGVE